MNNIQFCFLNNCNESLVLPKGAQSVCFFNFFSKESPRLENAALTKIFKENPLLQNVRVNDRRYGRSLENSALLKAVVHVEKEKKRIVLVDPFARKREVAEEIVSEFQGAIDQASVKVVDALLEKEYDPNCKIKGQTLLQYALRQNQLKSSKESFEIICSLVEHGADFDCYNSIGDTPLHTALRQKRWDLLELFFSSPKADPNIKNKVRDSLLAFSCKALADQDAFNAISVLVKNQKTDLNLKSHELSSTYTPLEISLLRGKTKTARLLFAHLDKERVKKEIPSLLCIAAKNLAVKDEGCEEHESYVGFVKELILAGFDLEAQDRDGFTALTHAILRNRRSLVRLFVLSGAKLIEINEQSEMWLQVRNVYQGNLKALSAEIRQMEQERNHSVVEQVGQIDPFTTNEKELSHLIAEYESSQ